MLESVGFSDPLRIGIFIKVPRQHFYVAKYKTFCIIIYRFFEVIRTVADKLLNFLTQTSSIYSQTPSFSLLSSHTLNSTLKTTLRIHPRSPEIRRKKKKKTMRTLIPLSLTTILSLLLISSIAEASILEETCKSVTAARPNIGYEFCVTSLRTDPGSSSTDPHGLAVIATRLSLAKAANTESRIDQLMVVESKPFLKDCFSVCSEVYSEAIDQLNDAIRNLEARLYGEALTLLSAALDAADNCEDAFGDAGGGLLSPLAREDEDYGRLADIALTITASLG